MTDLIRQHLAAIQAEEQRAQQALQMAQQQVQELSVACLKLAGGREALELLVVAFGDGKDCLGHNGVGVKPDVSQSHAGPEGVHLPSRQED